MLDLLVRPIRVHPFFGYRNAERLRISARALRTGAPDFTDAGRWQAFRTMMGQFLSREVAELPVRLEVAQSGGGPLVFHGVTDREGYLHFDVAVAGPAASADTDPEWETVTLHWRDRYGAHSADGFVLSPGTATALAVISDIDDTIIETGITGSVSQIARNWRRVLAELPNDRLLVPGADMFYQALGGGAVQDEAGGHLGEHHRATRNPFFYISSSPWNLFSYLVAFQRGRDLPLGPLMLRDWGANAATFGRSSHAAHKRAAIDALLAFYPRLDFALIGDDTQGDLIAYGETVTRHPDRIRAVFVRAVGEPHSPEETAARAAIERAGVPLWFGGDYAQGQAFLRSVGLGGSAPARRVVATTVKEPAAAPPAAAG